ncbi:MAG TPA: Nramp family divalent metal transporter [Blastocatellia bacterium]|nr:Nramp family divalent metal transporter [Blastocatellia bacterium]
MLRKTGPGIILAASIVGSGELIATTTLGAQVGYAALWIILLSCFIKLVIQAEWGRFTIASGETGLESFNSTITEQSSRRRRHIRGYSQTCAG